MCGGGGGATGKALGLIAAVFLAAVGGQIQEDAGLAEPGADSSLQLWAEADKDIRVAEYTLTDAGWERLELFMTLNIRRFLNFVEEEVRKECGGGEDRKVSRAKMEPSIVEWSGVFVFG